MMMWHDHVWSTLQLSVFMWCKHDWAVDGEERKDNRKLFPNIPDVSGELTGNSPISPSSTLALCHGNQASFFLSQSAPVLKYSGFLSRQLCDSLKFNSMYILHRWYLTKVYCAELFFRPTFYIRNEMIKCSACVWLITSESCHCTRNKRVWLTSPKCKQIKAKMIWHV